MQNATVVIVSAFCLLLFAFLLWPSLNNLYNNPTYTRDDYRSIAALVREDAQDGDAVLFIAPNQWEVFTFYYPDVAKTFPLLYRPQSQAMAEAELQRIAANKNRLFVLYYAEREADPDGGIEQWLATNAFKAEERWIGNIRLTVYAAPAPLARVGSDAIFDNKIYLLGYGGSTHLAGPVHTGRLVPLAFEWRTQTQLAARYTVFVHIGKPDAPPIAQNDGEPVAGFRPTDAWPVGEVIRDQRAVWIKPGTPPGQYAIFVGLYDANTGTRLILPDGKDRLHIGEIVIADN